MKERIDRNIVSPTEQPVLPQDMMHHETHLLEGHEYTIAGQSHLPSDKDKTEPIVFLVREPDRLVEHDRFIRKNEL